MASTIQVDNIKDIGGNTMISSNGSGTFTSNLPDNDTGKIGQVLSSTYSSAATTSSTSYVDTGITITITPSAIASKILVVASIIGMSATDSGSGVSLQLLQDTTKISETINVLYQVTAQANIGIVLQALSSPATTGAVTYKVQMKNRIASAIGINTTDDSSNITVYEVLA